jgi:hypothetical protein
MSFSHECGIQGKWELTLWLRKRLFQGCVPWLMVIITATGEVEINEKIMV